MLHIQWRLSQISVIKIEFSAWGSGSISRRFRLDFFDKKCIQQSFFFNILNRVIQLPNLQKLQYLSPHIIKNFRQIEKNRLTVFCVQVNLGQLYIYLYIYMCWCACLRVYYLVLVPMEDTIFLSSSTKNVQWGQQQNLAIAIHLRIMGSVCRIAMNEILTYLSSLLIGVV